MAERIMSEHKPQRRLFVRLSSLGDVILATSALSALPSGEKADWLTSAEFAQLLEGHPSIGKLWCFDRRGGLKAWIRLAREVERARYDVILDLHCSLRTRILKILIKLWSLRAGHRPEIRSIRKQRWKLWSYFALKGLWPRRWRPAPMAARAAMVAGGTGRERPDLRHLKHTSGQGREWAESSPYICVMPGAAWPGKIWPAERYLEALRARPELPVVLGTDQDTESARLVELFRKERRPAKSGIGTWNLREVARVLAGARAFLGNDTGLAHLAEAVGTPAVVVFGPTVPDMGFGPSGPRSVAVGSRLWCRPCGKDGRNCFRIHRYRCLKELDAELVRKPLDEAIHDD